MTDAKAAGKLLYDTYVALLNVTVVMATPCRSSGPLLHTAVCYNNTGWLIRDNARRGASKFTALVD